MPSPGASRRPTTPELPPLIVIAGATATGKTALGVDLARRFAGAEIVSADSRQVYRGLDIATAKPTTAERAAAPHHGLDLVDPDQRFTASDYRRIALDALTGIAARGGLALLVGGTGLYLRTIARGLTIDQGDSDEALRVELNARLEAGGSEPLVAELRERDREGAEAIDLRNPRRVVRALERAILTGSAQPPEPQGYPAPVTWLGLALEPDAHRRRIRARIDEHFEAGLLDEAAGLRERYPEDLPAFSAMGYHEAFDVLAGRCRPEEAKEHDATRTWAYARRQRTWFRSEPGISWLEAGERAGELALATLAPWLRRLERGDYAGSR
ncbi:MAG: tRNA (adenosine(37)-N6)-dimethylallyltransferase MiaA [Chloroflexota bacterium]|jgi:tRNA dimethylallyltransferase